MSDDQLDLLKLLESMRQAPIDALLTPDQIFESDDADLFARLTEDARFDRKSSRIQPSALGVPISAFSNGPSIEGGVIVVGIDNKTRKIDGCNNLSEDRLQMLETASYTYCPLAKTISKRVPFLRDNGDGDFVIVYRVQYVPDRLVELTNGEAYQRIGDKSISLSDTRKHQIRIDKGERSFESEVSNLEYPDDFDTPQLRRFCNRVREARQSAIYHSDTEILDALRLGRRVDGQFIPNNACTLLFSKDPQRIFPGAYVRFLRYQGTEEKSGSEYNVIKDRVIEGSIGHVIREAAQLIDANMREFTEFRSGKFFSVYEYPKDAWYELLVNACVHRSYVIKNVPIFIKMFDDRIVFESPGGFMPGVTPQNIYERHHPRNPFIMAVLRETGEVKCINEGTKRIRREMAQANLPEPSFLEKKGDTASFVGTLLNNINSRSNTLDSKAYAALGEAISLSLSPGERKIVNYIMAHGRINASDALRILTTTRWHTAKRLLDSLASRGILKFFSSKPRDPNAFYELAKEVPGEDSPPQTAAN